MDHVEASTIRRDDLRMNPHQKLKSCPQLAFRRAGGGTGALSSTMQLLPLPSRVRHALWESASLIGTGKDGLVRLAIPTRGDGSSSHGSDLIDVDSPDEQNDALACHSPSPWRWSSDQPQQPPSASRQPEMQAGWNMPSIMEERIRNAYWNLGKNQDGSTLQPGGDEKKGGAGAISHLAIEYGISEKALKGIEGLTEVEFLNHFQREWEIGRKIQVQIPEPITQVTYSISNATWIARNLNPKP